MADIPGLIAGLAICPDVVTPAADKQMLHRAIANLVGIPFAEHRAGNKKLTMDCIQSDGRANFPG